MGATVSHVNSSLERNLLWLAVGSAICAALAWVAFQIQQEQVAPALLFPLAAGGLLGAALVALGRYARPRRGVAIGSAIAWGLLLVVGQDYIGHRQRLAQLDAELARSHPLATALAVEQDVRPTFARHLSSRLQAEPVWWPLDFVLTLLAVGTVVTLGTRPPGPAAGAVE